MWEIGYYLPQRGQDTTFGDCGKGGRLDETVSGLLEVMLAEHMKQQSRYLEKRIRFIDMAPPLRGLFD
jgi:hypothetical protein